MGSGGATRSRPGSGLLTAWRLDRYLVRSLLPASVHAIHAETHELLR